jgi:hypothetical protein
VLGNEGGARPEAPSKNLLTRVDTGNQTTP